MNTQEQPVQPETSDHVPAQTHRNFLPVILIGSFLLILAAAGGIGYWDGTRQRNALDQQQVEAYLEDQYNLALGNIQAGQYDLAQQRLEEILKRNPSYPGAQDTQKKVEILLHTTPTPLPTETPIPSPTPNVALGEQMYQKAQQQYKEKNYNEMIATLLSIQKDIPTYDPLRVEGLLFLGYEQEGLAEIEATNLETGLYHLWVASEYAPLDSHALGRKQWAENVLNTYQAAYRYRKTDPEKSIISFSIVYAMAPGYRSTLDKDYQDTLDAFVKGKDNCSIMNKMNELMGNANEPNDKKLLAKRDAASDLCPRPTAVPAAGPVATATSGG